MLWYGKNKNKQERRYAERPALEQASGKKVYLMSAIAKQGIFDCLLEVNKYITRKRKNKNEVAAEEAAPAETKPWSPLD